MEELRVLSRVGREESVVLIVGQLCQEGLYRVVRSEGTDAKVFSATDDVELSGTVMCGGTH